LFISLFFDTKENRKTIIIRSNSYRKLEQGKGKGEEQSFFHPLRRGEGKKRERGACYN